MTMTRRSCFALTFFHHGVAYYTRSTFPLVKDKVQQDFRNFLVERRAVALRAFVSFFQFNDDVCRACRTLDFVQTAFGFLLGPAKILQ